MEIASPVVPSLPTATAVIEYVQMILSLPGAQANLERRGDRHRLRYRVKGVPGDTSARKALDLPADDAIVAHISRLIEEHRRNRKRTAPMPVKKPENGVPQELAPVLRRVLDSCPRGRVVRRRIALVFRIAAGLGYEALVDFLGREPWLARPNRAGRPRKHGHA